jgi:hypothetical protein
MQSVVDSARSRLGEEGETDAPRAEQPHGPGQDQLPAALLPAQYTMGSMRDEVFVTLTRHGIDTTRVDTMAVRTLLRRVPAKGRSVAVDSLVKP